MEYPVEDRPVDESEEEKYGSTSPPEYWSPSPMEYPVEEEAMMMQEEVALSSQAAAPVYTTVSKYHYCKNRGGVGGSNQYSRYMNRKGISHEQGRDECAAIVAATPGCGPWFSYGTWWCDCVPADQGECDQTRHIEYTVHKVDDVQAAAPAYTTVNKYHGCKNRGGVGGSNQYSTYMNRKGISHEQGRDECAAIVAATPGCGPWFSYGTWWCDCVPADQGDCDQTRHIEYTVHKLEQAAKCQRPTGWCVHKGATFVMQDCDGDGVPDPYCADGQSSGFVSSKSSCTDTWPKGACRTQAHFMYTTVSKHHYCKNHGGIGPSNPKYSKYMNRKGISHEQGRQECADHVASTPGCGPWFSYGTWWCTCVPFGQKGCDQTRHHEYTVHKLED